MLDLCLADSRFLYFSQILESIHKFIIELNALQSLFARGSNKQQSRGRVASNFTKVQTFSSLWQPGVLQGNLTMWLTLCTLQKRTSFPLQFCQKENIPRNSIERIAYWFVLKMSRVFPIPTGKVGIGWWILL